MITPIIVNFLRICLSGSHDSFAYHMINRLCSDAPWTMGINKGFTKKWAVCQKMGPKDQLEAGIRYFDIRTAYDTTQSTYRACHTLLGDPLKDIMEEISVFLTDHSREVVLDFNHFYGLTDETHTRMLDMIIDIFGSKLCPVGNISSITLNVMWQKGYQVLAFYDNESADNRLEIWPGENIESPWLNTDDPAVLLAKVESLIGRQSPDKFHVLQGVLTPSPGLVLKSLPVGSFFTGVKNLESYVTKNEVTDRFLKLLDDSESKGGINICIADFVERSDNKFATEICKFNNE